MHELVNVGLLLHRYVNPPVPPVTLTQALPFACVQLELVEVIVATKGAGCVMVVVFVVTHPKLSVIWMVCVPGGKLFTLEVLFKVGNHKKVYGPVPPLYATLAVPLFNPLQVMLALVKVDCNAAGWVMITWVVTLQPLVSVTVTE